MTKGKKVRLLAGVLILCAFGGVCTTAAYQTSYDKVLNSITVGSNETETEEDFPTPSPIPIPDRPSYRKSVRVTNRPTGGNGAGVPCFVRVMLTYSNYDIGRAVTLDGLNLTDWDYSQEDGYYYYRSILLPGESTAELFSGFTIDPSLVDDTCRAHLDQFSIQVYEESVQAGDFQEYTQAWKHYLQPVRTV